MASSEDQQMNVLDLKKLQRAAREHATASCYDFDDGNLLDLSGMSPLLVISLYERQNLCYDCRDNKYPYDDFHMYDDNRPCSCKPIAKMKIKHIIISVIGNPVSSLPNDSIYHIDAIYGVKNISPEESIDDILMRNNITELEHTTFSIYNSMDEQDMPNKETIKTLFTYSGRPDKFDITYFKTFQGAKKYDSYGLQFLNLLENYMKPASPATAIQREQKANPHVGRKKKSNP